MDLDTRAKREELFILWNDTIDICKAVITAAKQHPSQLKASMLKEITGALKTSSEMLDKMEEYQRKVEIEESFDEDEEIAKIQRVLMEAEGDLPETGMSDGRSAQADAFRVRP